MPSDLAKQLKASGSSRGGGANVFRRPASRNRETVATLLAEAEEAEAEKDSGGGGILGVLGDAWDATTGAVGDVGGALMDVASPILRTADLGRAAVVATAAEAGDFLGDAIGVSEGEGSFQDWKDNVNRRVTVGDIITEQGGGIPVPGVTGALGLLGDVVLDPLTYLTAGSSAAAKVGSNAASRALGREAAAAAAAEGGDALARNAARQAARGRVGLAARDGVAGIDNLLAEHGTDLRTLLAGRGMSNEAIDRSLQALDRGTGLRLDFGRLGSQRVGLPPRLAGSRLGSFTGRNTSRGLDALSSGGMALAESRFGDAGRALRRAFSPLDEVRQTIGRDVADEIPGVYHRRDAVINRLTDDTGRSLGSLANDLDDEAKETILNTLRRDTTEGGVDNLFSFADETANEVERVAEGLRQAGNTTAADTLIALDDYQQQAAALLRESGGDVGTLLKGTEETTDPFELVRTSWQTAAEAGGNKFAVDELKRIGEEIGADLVRLDPAEGFTKIGNRYVKKEVADSIFNLQRQTPNELVGMWDTFQNAVKKWTLFNPVAFGPYFVQNMATALSMNAAHGMTMAGLREAMQLDNAFHGALKAGREVTEGLSDEAAQFIKELREQNILSPLDTPFENVVQQQQHKTIHLLGKDRKINPTASTIRLNQRGEEVMRSALYMSKRRAGLTADEAAEAVRRVHLDYSAVGKTAFERNVLGRFLFFPTWLIRAPGAIARTYAHRPGMAMNQARLEQGTRFYDREKNEYGDPIGPRFSGPMSFVLGLGEEGGGTVHDPREAAGPLARFITDPGARKLTDVIPPLSSVTRARKLNNDPEYLQQYLRQHLGVREGIDYAQRRGENNLAENIAKREQENVEREAEGKPPLPLMTPSMLLKEAAATVGVPGAWEMTKAEAVKAMLDAGVPEMTLNELLAGVDPQGR